MLQKPQIIFTPKGLEEKKSELEKLTQKRKEVVERLSLARSQGDLSENAAYKSAKFELGMTDRQLHHLENVIKNAKVIKNENNGTVQIGSIITINDGKKTRQLSLVGGYESDPLEGKISHHSPIGKALIGKKIGDSISISVPAGQITYNILTIA